MNVIVAEPLSEEWFYARRQGITATDAAAIMGVHKFKSALDVYNDKLQMPVKSDPPSDAMKAGNYFEDGVRKWYADVTGWRVEGSPGLVQHGEEDWMLATPDGIIHNPNRSEIGLYEGKTSNYFARDEWDDGVPLFYQVQCQHQMEVCDMDWAGIGCVTGGQTPHFEHVVERDPDFIDTMMEILEAFYRDNILAIVPPAPTAQDTETLSTMFPRSTEGATVPLSIDAVEAAREYKDINAQMKVLKTRQSGLKNQIRMEIGAAEFGRGPDFRIKTTLRKRDSYQVKESNFRDFRFVKHA